jgi:predicted Zn finger-like uncharacterized protein
MHTRCPECQTQRSIDVNELRESRAMIRCDHCLSMYDALEMLSDKETEVDIKEFKYRDHKPSSFDFKLPFAVTVLLFIGQLIYFEGSHLPHQAQFRPLLSWGCEILGCQLPVYCNREELATYPAVFEPEGNDGYRFQTAITNQALFKQKLPDLQLTLLNVKGQRFAQRIFTPAEYAPQMPDLLQADDSIEINLLIAAPKQTLGGYLFKLI